GGVHLELFPSADRDHRADDEDAPRANIEARPRPDLTPGVARDQILEFRVERGGLRDRAIDMRIAQHFASNPETGPSSLFVIHESSDRQSAVMKSRTTTLNSVARSTLDKCAASSSTTRA